MTAFYHARVAEACFARGFAQLAEQHARAALSGVEDAAYITHLAKRVLAFLEYQRSPSEPELRSRLHQLRSDAELAGLASGVELIERVLAAGPTLISASLPVPL
jgi:hypothetical protein